MKTTISKQLMNQQNWLYLLLAFPIVDYILRNFIRIPIVPSLWDEGVLVVLLIFMLIRILETGRTLPSITKPIVALVIMGLAYLIMDMPYLNASIEGFRAMFQYMVAFFIGFYFFGNKESLIKAVKFIVMISTVVGFIGVMQFILGVETPKGWVDSSEDIRTRAFSIVQSPNVLGSHMAFIFPIAAALIFVEKKKLLRFIWIAAALIAMACLIFTYSRGAWLAFAGAIAIISILIDRRLLFVGAILAAAGLFLVPEIGDRFTHLFSADYFEKSSQSGRINRWLGAFHQIRKEPFFGNGLGHYGGAVADRHFGVTYVDSYYFKTLAETGLLGMSLFIWLLLSIFKNGYNTWKQTLTRKESIFTAGLFTALIVLMLHNAVENIFEVPYLNTYFWLVTGFLLSYPFLKRTEGLEKNQTERGSL